MKVVKWEPKRELDLFRDFERFEEDMGKMFEFPLTLGERGVTGLGKGWKWAPVVDVIDHKDSITVKAEIPGIKKEDIDISICGDYLTIRGEKKEEKEEKGKNYQRSERFYGTFDRSLTLPGYVDESKVTANYRDGILHVTLPKKEGRKEKHIRVSVR